MGQRFPAARAAKREMLLAAVERVRDTILTGAAAAEENATLPPATVAAALRVRAVQHRAAGGARGRRGGPGRNRRTTP